MGVYYDFYLEKLVEKDKWSPIQYGDSDVLYSVRNHARSFFDEYGAAIPLGFQWLSQEYQEKNLEKYENSNEIEKRFLCDFYEMDLDRMMRDYNSGLHEYAGIISRNAYKHLLSDSEYEAKIIDEEVYSRFSDDIKQNYVYHEWDSFYGEYYYLYEIIPRVEKIMNADGLSLDQVRLLCRIC